MEASNAFYETSNQEALKKYQNVDYRIKKTQVCWLGRNNLIQNNNQS